MGSDDIIPEGVQSDSGLRGAMIDKHVKADIAAANVRVLKASSTRKSAVRDI